MREPAAEYRTYAGAGGRPLRMQVVAASPARHHLLYVHGIESHGGWFLPAAHLLREHGCTTWLLDRRGSGLNREQQPGDAASAAILLEDVRRARAELGGPRLHLVGLSWGGKLATAAAIDEPRDLASLVLVTPGLCARVGFSVWQRLAIAASLLRGGDRHFEVPLRPEMFTAEPAILEFIRGDPLRLTTVTARFLWATHQLDRAVRRGVAQLHVPVLLLLAGRDRIVDNARVLRLLAGLPAGQLEVRHYEAAMHSIQLECTAAMVDDIVAFLEAHAPSW